MILVDTSVWADHFSRSDERLAAHLRDGAVAIHPLVLLELDCGNLPRRNETLSLLGALPRVPEASHAEVHTLIERYRLQGHGLGAVDAHLLGSALLGRTALWTRDRTLAAAAARIGIPHE